MVAQRKRVSIAVLFVTLMGTSTPILAATSVSSLGVSVTISDSCQINSPDPSGSAFGSGETLFDPAQETSVNCSLGTPFQVGTKANSLQETGVSGIGQASAATILTITY